MSCNNCCSALPVAIIVSCICHCPLMKWFCTDSFGCNAIWKTSGNSYLNIHWCQLSCQQRNVFPCPIWYVTRELKTYPIFCISLQKSDGCCSSQGGVFAAVVGVTSFHHVCVLLTHCYIHFSRNATFVCCKSLTPSPPSLLDLVTSAQLVRCIGFALICVSLWPCHRKRH
jgi:hypothetical protein